MTIVCHCKKCGCEFEYERTAPHAKPKYCRDCKRTIQSERRKAWHDSHKEYDREYARKWRAANPDYFAVYYGRKGIKRISANRVAPSTFVCTECSREFEHEFRGVRPRFCPACIRAHNRARGKAWLKAHPEVERVMRRRKHWKQRAREYFDADYYAKRRKRDRERSVKYRDRTIFAKKPRKLRGGVYHPQPSRTVPDWCRRGDVLDFRSPWIFENATDSQKAYAKELFIEWKERRRIAR